LAMLKRFSPNCFAMTLQLSDQSISQAVSCL
jgi:hypothetical protein